MRRRSGGLITVCLVTLLGHAGCSDPADPVPPVGTVRGTVYVRYSTESVPGARVRCQGVSTSTDPQGDYRLNGVPQGAAALSVTADGFRGYSEDVDVGEFQTINPVLVPLDTLADVSGLVRHLLDGPLQASITLGDTTVMSDIDGRWDILDWPHGRYAFSVTHPAYVPYDTTVAVYRDGQSLTSRIFREVQQTMFVRADASIHWDEDDGRGNNDGDGTMISIQPDPFRTGLFMISEELLPEEAMVIGSVLRLQVTIRDGAQPDPWSFPVALRGVSNTWYETSVDGNNHPDFFSVPGSPTVTVPANTDTFAVNLDITALFALTPTGRVTGVSVEPAGSSTPKLEAFAKEIIFLGPEYFYLMPQIDFIYRY